MISDAEGRTTTPIVCIAKYYNNTSSNWLNRKYVVAERQMIAITTAADGDCACADMCVVNNIIQWLTLCRMFYYGHVIATTSPYLLPLNYKIIRSRIITRLIIYYRHIYNKGVTQKIFIYLNYINSFIKATSFLILTSPPFTGPLCTALLIESEWRWCGHNLINRPRV